MGKIVKYCNSCEEGFAEKFGFCPNCGKQLQAFEMVPQIGETYIPQTNKVSAEPKTPVQEVKAESFETAKLEPIEPTPALVPPIAAAPVVEEPIEQKTSTETFSAPEPLIEEKFEEVKAEPIKETAKVEEVKEDEPKTFAVSAASAADNYYQNAYSGKSSANNQSKRAQSDGFYVTVIEDKDGGKRNALLLGTLVVFCMLMLSGVVYSIFNKQLGVGAIEQGDLIAFVPAVEPVPIENEPPPKKDNDDGGGRGGGGKDAQEPVQKGRLANQEEKPMIAPSKTLVSVTKPSIPIQASTQGNIKRAITDEQYGLPKGIGVKSDGAGSGGGMGGGNGRGMGNGRGTGEGNGIGSGSGNGDGTGNGNGTGPGSGGAPPPPPAAKPKPAVTTAMRITSKPRASYTDAARQNNVQGTVTLRVTFLASGQIGSISPVSGLPYGLTEQAIAAARGIRFEPQMVNGQPQSVTKSVQYSFTIY